MAQRGFQTPVPNQHFQTGSSGSGIPEQTEPAFHRALCWEQEMLNTLQRQARASHELPDLMHSCSKRCVRGF